MNLFILTKCGCPIWRQYYTPMFSKIERGDRRAKRSQVIMLAEYFHVDEKEMLTLWLADKILDALEGEDSLALDAIGVAEKTIRQSK